MPDRNELTPITPLSARIELERVCRESRANTEGLGSLAAEMAETKRVALATADAVAAHLRDRERRPPMSTRKFVAILGAATTLTMGFFQYRSQALGAEARASAVEVTRQNLDARRERELEEARADERAKTLSAQMQEFKRWHLEQEVEAQRRASMRTPNR